MVIRLEQVSKRVDLTVQGEGVTERVPELTNTTIAIRVSSPDRNDALNRAAEINNALMEDAREFKRQGSVASYSSLALTLRKVVNKDDSDSYLVLTDINMSFIDTEAMTAWISDAVERYEEIQINGFTLSFSEVTYKMMIAEARQLAIADAILRAEAYATAARFEQIEFVSIEEQPVTSRAYRSNGSPQVGSVGAAGVSSSTFEFSAKRVPITASVVVKFSMS